MKCDKHNIDLECLGGCSAHRSNWHCPECEEDLHLQEAVIALATNLVATPISPNNLAFDTDGRNTSDLYAQEIIKTISENVLDKVLAIVLKEPDYIAKSQSTRLGYVHAVNDMKRKINLLRKNNS